MGGIVAQKLRKNVPFWYRYPEMIYSHIILRVSPCLYLALNRPGENQAIEKRKGGSYKRKEID